MTCSINVTHALGPKALRQCHVNLHSIYNNSIASANTHHSNEKMLLQSFRRVTFAKGKDVVFRARKKVNRVYYECSPCPKALGGVSDYRMNAG